MGNWPTLSKPPVVLALFQLKYSPHSLDFNVFNKFDERLKSILPVRRDNIQVGLDLSDVRIPLGKSTITGKSEAKINLHVYLSKNQKVRLEISDGTITYLEESPYAGWDTFKHNAVRCVAVLAEALETTEILRTSIRFINHFHISDFRRPEEYFTSLISRSADGDKDLPFPLRQYSFRLVMDIPDTEIYSICNHSAEPIDNEGVVYTLDIDVLDRSRLIFDMNALSDTIERLRDIKNKIFFSSITQKTQDLCD